MNLLSILEIIFNNAQNEIQKSNLEASDVAKQEDKQWLEKLNKKCILKTNNKVYTAKEGIIEAKKQRNKILLDLTTGKNDEKTQIKLGEDLVYLNKVIYSYDTCFIEKENVKNEAILIDAKNKKSTAVKNAIEDSIKKINEQITKMVGELDELKQDIVNCNNIEELDKKYEKYKNIVQLNKFKNAMQELLSINGVIKSETALASLKEGLIDEHKSVVESYYKLIILNGINLKRHTKSKDTDFGKSDNENAINEINYYFDIAKEKNSKEALNYAVDLIKLINDKDLRGDLESEAASISSLMNTKPKKDLSKEVQQAKELVEIVKKTGKVKDFKNALKAKNSLPEGEQRDEISKELLEVCEKNKNNFDKLFNKILDDICLDKNLLEDEINELTDRYQYLKKDYVSEIQNEYDKIITIYNNQVQKQYQKSLNEKDIEKYSAADKFREIFGGIIVNFFSGAIKNSHYRRLNKLQEKLSEEKNEAEEKKINKVKEEISESDVVSGIRLFVSRNKLAKKKPKLYKEDVNNKGFKKVSEDEILYQTRETDNISKLLTRGLNKKLRDSNILNSKSSAITILEQYLELISSGTYNADYVIEAYNFLKNVEDVLSESEYKGYYDEIRMIDEYRKSNYGMPYHMNNKEDHNEVDDVIKYYDSEEYQEALKEGRFIKRN